VRDAGTGKTSFIKALACHTGRSIINIPLSRIKTNQQLTDMMFDQRVQVRAGLLLLLLLLLISCSMTFFRACLGSGLHFLMIICCNTGWLACIRCLVLATSK
jgi:hypothetical protein